MTIRCSPSWFAEASARLHVRFGSKKIVSACNASTTDVEKEHFEGTSQYCRFVAVNSPRVLFGSPSTAVLTACSCKFALPTDQYCLELYGLRGHWCRPPLAMPSVEPFRREMCPGRTIHVSCVAACLSQLRGGNIARPGCVFVPRRNNA